MSDSLLQKQIEKKEMELKALLEITQAINDNVSEDSLYKIFKFTVLSNLRLKKFALFVFEEIWIGKVFYGVKSDQSKFLLDAGFSVIKDIHSVKGLKLDSVFDEFDLIIPVTHQDRTLALVFVEDRVSEIDPHDRNENLGFLQALSNIILVAIENQKLARQTLHQEAYRKELEIARDVQQLLFPEKLPNTGKVVLKASYLPHDKIGGDYYDYIPFDDHSFMVCIADVSGKGVGAALMMSNFQASLRALVRQTRNLTEIIETLNQQVLQATKGEKFITAFLAIYNAKEGSLKYINAGHNPPVLIFSDGKTILLEEGCTVLGATNKIPSIRQGNLEELKDFLLFCYTDGLTETISEHGIEFGLKPLLDYFEHGRAKDLSTIHQDIIIALDGFKGTNGYRDDITLLSCRVQQS
jgi:sigma-B regulation protein RsbU (phosphoserine phosphatase)